MKRTLLTLSVISGLLLLLFAAFSVFAQDEPDYGPSPDSPIVNLYLAEENRGQVLIDQAETEDSETIASREANSELTTETSATCQTGNCAFLPVLNNPPDLVLPFVFYRTSCSSSFSDSPIDSSNRIVLGSGQRTLAFSMLARGYSSSRYETRFLINGSEIRSLRTSGTISSTFQPIVSAQVVYGTTGSCQSVLPSGEYTAQFYVNGQLKKQVTAVLP